MNGLVFINQSYNQAPYDYARTIRTQREALRTQREALTQKRDVFGLVFKKLNNNDLYIARQVCTNFKTSADEVYVTREVDARKKIKPASVVVDTYALMKRARIISDIKTLGVMSGSIGIPAAIGGVVGGLFFNIPGALMGSFIGAIIGFFIILIQSFCSK